MEELVANEVHRHTGEIAIMGIEGDTKILWDKENDDEVGIARQTFNDLKKKGFAMFKVKKLGGQGDKITEFDSELQAIIAVPAIRGG